MSRATALSVPRARPGTTLVGDCTAIRHLARSDVYDVYDAWCAHRGCRVAVKLLRPDRQDDRRARAALVREGRRLARLSHPHLARVYAVSAGSPPAVVLETLGGATLAALIDGEPRRASAANLAVLGLQLCSALTYLHGQDLLHLDLKPSNVVVDSGRARLIDLGAARAPGPASAGSGTWCYCAPEQAAGGDLTAATDVWGAGIVLWEAATGALAYGDDPRDEDEEHPQLARRVDLVGTLRRLPRPLAAVIDAALTLEPAGRPPLRELARVCEAVAGLPPRERRLGRRLR